MLASIALFAIGSAICGAAHSLNMLIAGRGERLTMNHIDGGSWHIQIMY